MHCFVKSRTCVRDVCQNHRHKLLMLTTAKASINQTEESVLEKVLSNADRNLVLSEVLKVLEEMKNSQKSVEMIESGLSRLLGLIQRSHEKG
jgi:glucose-6-phosphate 1-dehydrogenase